MSRNPWRIVIGLAFLAAAMLCFYGVYGIINMIVWGAVTGNLAMVVAGAILMLFFLGLLALGGIALMILGLKLLAQAVKEWAAHDSW